MDVVVVQKQFHGLEVVHCLSVSHEPGLLLMTRQRSCDLLRVM